MYDNGIIENVKEGIVLVKQEDGMEFEAVNMLPNDQLLLVAIALHQLYLESFGKSVEDDPLDMILSSFIYELLQTDNKGDVLQ
jgi:hypothetical protein